MSPGGTTKTRRLQLERVLATSFSDLKEKHHTFEEEHNFLFDDYKKYSNFNSRLEKDKNRTKKDLAITVVQLLDHNSALRKYLKICEDSWIKYGYFVRDNMIDNAQENVSNPISVDAEEINKIDSVLANTKVLLNRTAVNNEDKTLDDLSINIQQFQKNTEEQYSKFDAILHNTQELLAKSDNYLNNSKLLEKELRSDIKILFDTSKTFSSYAEAVKSSSNSDNTTSQVRHAIKEELNFQNRKFNIMIFGLEGATENDVQRQVKDMFQSIDVNVDNMELSILNSNSGKIRPIKVKFADEWKVGYVLRRAKCLKETRYRNVFLAPDRSPTERTKRRALVQEMTNKVKQDQSRRWFIKNGRVEHAVITTD